MIGIQGVESFSSTTTEVRPMAALQAFLALPLERLRHTAAACSPTPCRVTSSRAIAVSRSSSSSIALQALALELALHGE
jgi:hypothetical protein